MVLIQITILRSSWIRNCHINIGTGKEITIRSLADLIVQTVGYQGEIVWDETKPNGTPRKLIDVDKLHSLGWTHRVEIEEGVTITSTISLEAVKDLGITVGAKAVAIVKSTSVMLGEE